MRAVVAAGLVIGLLATGCSDGKHHRNGIYVLVNTSKNQSWDPAGALQVIRYLLEHSMPTDTLAAASIGTEHFSAADIIARTTFDKRPSVANQQKIVFKDRFLRFSETANNGLRADFSGGMLEAIEYLNQCGSQSKIILILSDLKETTSSEAARDFPFPLAGFDVVLLDRADRHPTPRERRYYLHRAERLRVKVENGYGRLQRVEELHHLEKILRKNPQSNGNQSVVSPTQPK